MKDNVGKRRIRIFPYIVVFLVGIAAGMYIQPKLNRIIQEKLDELSRRTYAVMALNQTGINQ